MKSGIVKIIMLAFCFMLFHETVKAQKSFKARCEQKKAECGVSFDKEYIEAHCSYPPSDAKEGVPYGNIVVTYRCEYEKQGDEKVIVCKGYLGLSPDKKITFTSKEFLDPDIRGSKLCFSCAEGWKNIKSSQ
jgi:hypothetical protein